MFSVHATTSAREIRMFYAKIRERVEREYRPVTVRRNEVETAVDTIVFDVPTVQSRLVSVVLLKLTVNVVFYRLPAGQHNVMPGYVTKMM